jgi:hypothetical protein
MWFFLAVFFEVGRNQFKHAVVLSKNDANGSTKGDD